MTTPPDSWSELEQRLRSEAAEPPPGPEFIARVLHATREQPASGPARPRAIAWPRWGLLGLAAAAALMILLRPTPHADKPLQPDGAMLAPDWTISALEARAEDPLRTEWEGLHGDAARALSFLADCWPSADLAVPPS